MAEERDVRAVNAGKESALALQLVAPLLVQTEQDVLSTLLRQFRAGMLDGTAALLLVAQLAAIDSLRATLEDRVTAGQKAAVRVHGV